MRVLVHALFCCVLLVPPLALGQNESELAEPHYHWPVYPPFSPGSWAWPTSGWWHFPPFYQDYGYSQQYPSPTQAPQTIIVFPPAPALPSYGETRLSQTRVLPKESAAESKPQQGSPLYLIALKDGVIRPALSYSVEKKVLYYVDLDGTAKQVPLDRVDRTLSAELNRQRRVPFHLPPDE